MLDTPPPQFVLAKQRTLGRRVANACLITQIEMDVAFTNGDPFLMSVLGFFLGVAKESRRSRNRHFT